MGSRYHLRVDLVRVRIPRHCARRVQPPHRGLVLRHPHAHRTHHRRHRHGHRNPTPTPRSDSSQRPASAIRSHRFRPQMPPRRDRAVDGISRRLLRQQHGRIVLRDPRVRTVRPDPIPQPHRRPHRNHELHRLVQPHPPRQPITHPLRTTPPTRGSGRIATRCQPNRVRSRVAVDQFHSWPGSWPDQARRQHRSLGQDLRRQRCTYQRGSASGGSYPHAFADSR